jgi:hypothetical protein
MQAADVSSLRQHLRAGLLQKKPVGHTPSEHDNRPDSICGANLHCRQSSAASASHPCRAPDI